MGEGGGVGVNTGVGLAVGCGMGVWVKVGTGVGVSGGLAVLVGVGVEDVWLLHPPTARAMTIRLNKTTAAPAERSRRGCRAWLIVQKPPIQIQRCGLL